MIPLGVRAVAIVKRHANGFVLGPLDLAVGPGEFVAVVGPSLGGKSTLLAMLAGWEAPDHGMIEWSVGGASPVQHFSGDIQLRLCQSRCNVG